MSYINIQKSKDIGNNFDALLSNLGYCLSNTMSDDFYDKVFKIGFDFMDIISISLMDKNIVSKIIYESIEDSKNKKCGCTKNQYNINSCHIYDLSEMISSLSMSTVASQGVFNNMFQTRHLKSFFIGYFSILERSDKYNSLLETPMKLINNENKEEYCNL